MVNNSKGNFAHSDILLSVVIVSAKQCPRDKKQPGPEWYKLEVVNSTGFPVKGKFIKPSQRSEDRACEKNSVSQGLHGSFIQLLYFCLLYTADNIPHL